MGAVLGRSFCSICWSSWVAVVVMQVLAEDSHRKKSYGKESSTKVLLGRHDGNLQYATAFDGGCNVSFVSLSV